MVNMATGHKHSLFTDDQMLYANGAGWRLQAFALVLGIGFDVALSHIFSFAVLLLNLHNR